MRIRHRAAAALALASAIGWADGRFRPDARAAPSVVRANDMVARGRAAVVAAEPHAANVGLDVLKAGGNAVDAAVATFLALAVTYPQAGNLGGGGFMVVRMADGRTCALDFRERAGAAAHAGLYLREDGSVDVDRIRFGASAAGVPGSPAGIVDALELFGTKSLAELAAPAIRLARDGIEVSHFLAGALQSDATSLRRFASTRRVFFVGDRPLRQGERLVQPDLASTLERFAQGGRDGFYAGRTAELLIAAMRDGGGHVTVDDLASYRPVRRDVLRGTYRGHEILTMPPPSSGGVALLQMLNLLEPYDIAASGHGSSTTLHLLTEAMRRAYADRSRWLGDPDHWSVPVDGLVSKDYANRLRATMRTDRVSEVAPGVPPGAKESDDTTHFSVVDAAGNVVSCTTTINSTFGSMCVVDGAGFLLNNEMDDFSAKPGVPNQFGLVGGTANAIAPGKRMLSSMTPTIVLRDGNPAIVLGSPGGGRIINTVLQVISNVVDHGHPIEVAVAAPRIHHQWLPDRLDHERLALPADVREALAARGHRFAPRPISIGFCQAIQIAADGSLTAVADPRSGGAAAAR
jgi:gamma-glutamyltranspeptidase/glutathione hydrolase